MSSIWVAVAFLLGFLIVFQIAKASEYVAILKGEEKTRRDTNRINGFLLLAFVPLAGMVLALRLRKATVFRDGYER